MGFKRFCVLLFRLVFFSFLLSNFYFFSGVVKQKGLIFLDVFFNEILQDGMR